MNFPSIRLEGSVVSADLLDAVSREDKPSQKSVDFGLDPSSKVKDEIASTWASAKALWAGYQAKITNLREGQTGVSETRNLFVLPLLALLGYQPEKADAEILNGKSYAISHRDISRDGFPLHIMGWNDSLDKKRVSGGPRISSHALVQEYLNLTEHLYGLITNGRQLRLLRDSSRLIKVSFLEFDLVRIFEEDLYADFALLFRLLHATRMPANRASASGSVIEKYHQDSVDSGSRIRDGLAAAVAYSMQAIANGLCSHPANGNLVQQLREEPARANELHQNLLRWVYRTLFVLVIEERVLHHAPGTTLRQRQLYRDYYSLQRLRRLADRPQLADRRAHDLWRAMHQTLRLYEDGGKGLPLGIAPLGSFLFREKGLQALFQYELDNRSFLQALNRLSTFNHPDTNVRMRVNYGALDVEEFGSVYESLLELLPRIIPEGDKLTFSYAQLAGNERKTSGSYYTPDSLVQCLLDSALDPVVEQRLAGKSGQEAEAALLAIKVCDPAVGSGHFLIGAAHRLAQRLADIRAGEEALSPDVQRRALRDVVSHCLYGVDINPLAGELCKVSLWMLAMEPGKPLGFLDHHIQIGNSLLGVTPRVLDEGLPDAAFKPISGDDPDICREAKKLNKEERKQLALFHGAETKPWERLGNFPAAMHALDTMSDDTPAALHEKEKRYAELVKGASYKSARFLADAWCAAFVWEKTRKLPYPITNDVLRKIERNPHDCAPWMREEIERLRDHYQFFHWHLSFPEVFPVPEKSERPANERTGWNSGFDVILGNPPWDKVELLEREWFAERRPDIANCQTAAKRKRMIEGLATEDAQLFRTYLDAARKVDGQRHFMKEGRRFPLCSSGRANLYSTFVENSRDDINATGRVGCIVPSGIATDDSTKLFFRDLLERQQLVSFYDFENGRGIFPAVQGNVKFCLLTLAGGGSPDFEVAAQIDDIGKLGSDGTKYRLALSDVEQINPNTCNAPTFSSAKDAELNKAIYRRCGVFVKELPSEENPWSIKLRQGLFNMTSDSGEFRTSEELEKGGWVLAGNQYVKDGEVYEPLCEAKLMFQFDHRAATFSGTSEASRYRTHAGTGEVTLLHHKDATFVTLPRFWVRREVVQSEASGAKWFLVFRDIISAVADSRSLVAALVPAWGIGNTLPIVDVIGNAPHAALLLGYLNSFVADYFLRQKASGSHLNFYIFKQLPALPPGTYAEPCPWAGQPAVTHRDWLLPRVLELTYTAWDLEPFARDSGWFGPPFVWDEARRFQLRCELDAAFLHLYGLSRTDAAYILDTFPIVKRKDEAKFNGDYRTKRVILETYDALAESMRPGQS